MKVYEVVLDRRLSFDRHATSVARACNFHAHAIRHIRHLLTTELALTLACSLILSRLDYCNAVLHGAPASSIHKLQRHESFSGYRGSHLLNHCWKSYTGYQFANALTTSWPY